MLPLRTLVLRVVVACLLVGALGATVSHAALLVPHQSAGWKYKAVLPSDALNSSFYAAGFDDSGWPSGQAAFGGTTYPDFTNPACPLWPTVATIWGGIAAGFPDACSHPPCREHYYDTNMLIRRTFSANSNVKVHIGVDNNVNVWVNGNYVSGGTHEQCAQLDYFNFNVPDSYLNPSGNEIAIQAINTGGADYIDA